jgi:flagellar basal-body rod modification protein FlgD
MTVSLSNYVSNQATATSQISSSTSGTASDIASGASSLDTSYQTFLTLLTTQLKNQDPSSPMDPDTFTTELVQMTGVQQQLLSNQLLQQLVNASPSNGVTSAVDLIGKNVTSSNATSTLTNGSATWDYTLPSAATNATVTVTDSNGNVVYSGTAPTFAAGTNTFTWNGQTNSGTTEPSGGTYTLSMTATDASGTAMTPVLGVQGAATAVQNVAGSTMVTVNGVQVPLSSITSVGGS